MKDTPLTVSELVRLWEEYAHIVLGGKTTTLTPTFNGLMDWIIRQPYEEPEVKVVWGEPFRKTKPEVVEKWVPVMRQEYSHITEGTKGLQVGKSYWCNDGFDIERLESLGVYPTREAAEIALAKIKEAIKGI